MRSTSTGGYSFIAGEQYWILRSSFVKLSYADVLPHAYMVAL